LTDAELAILGLVVEKPRHGYEIEQVLEERDMREWAEIGFSSIYYQLKRLEKNGWVRSRIDPDTQQGPARKVYEVTQEGLAAWHTAILDALSIPRPHSDPFQLGLSSILAIPPADTLAALGSRRAALEQTLAHIRERRLGAAQHGAPPNVDAMFDLSITLLEAEVGWLNRFISLLENQ
jgi:DNA-binding PadR family transcriptional regulator